MPFRIKSVTAREILDSRGNPTVEADMVLSDGAFGRAAVPSGASTGTHEAMELRDNDPRRYLGKGTTKAVKSVTGPIAKGIRGRTFADQGELDAYLIRLDGTPQKGKLGANAILGCSMAAAAAQAASKGRALYGSLGAPSAATLPVPLLNVINGGAHADNGLDVQEFMLVPIGFTRFSEALRAGTEIYHHLKGLLKKKGLATAVGDEGGFAPRLPGNRAALDLLMDAIQKAGYAPGRQVRLSLDVASTEFYRDGKYHLEGKKLTSDRMVEILARWTRDYELFSIEDGLAEDDWGGWKMLTHTVGDRALLVGDDLYVTNPARLRRGIAEGTSNAILIKLNQIGSVTETVEAIRLSQSAGMTPIVSHRSGETEDTFIADLAVATGCPLIKTGAPSRTERVAKYNRLLRIEEELAGRAVYAGPLLLRRRAGKGRA